MSKRTKPLNLDALTGEPLVVTLKGKTHRVDDPPLSGYIKFIELLDAAAKNFSGESIAAVTRHVAQMTGIPSADLAGMSLRQYNVLVMELSKHFSNTRDNDAPAAPSGDAGPLAEAPTTPVN